MTCIATDTKGEGSRRALDGVLPAPSVRGNSGCGRVRMWHQLHTALSSALSPALRKSKQQAENAPHCCCRQRPVAPPRC